MSCDICGGPTHPFMNVRDYNRRVSSMIFHYLKCTSCESLILDPIPEDLGRYYPRDYYQFPSTVEARSQAAEGERHKLELLAHHVGQGLVLEIGPGGGGFAFLAKSAGYDVTVIEMDAAACSYLEEQVGVKVIKSSDPLATLQQTDQTYDAIAMWHVLEHLRDPIAVLEATARRLRPGGSLIVAVPNPEALQLSVFSRFWTHLDAPRHLRLVPSHRLVESLRGAGLEVVLNTTADAGGLGWDVFGWQCSAANLLTAPLPRLRRYRLLLLLRPLAILAATLARPFERRQGRGTTYTVVATRPPG